MATRQESEMSKTDKEWREEKSFPLVPMNNGQVGKGMGEGVTNGLTDDQQGICRPNKESHGGSEKRGDSDDIQCGVLSWRPACLRRFNNPQWLLFFFSLYAMALGFVVNGINNVNTTSIERRFNLASATVGLVSSAYDVSAAILGLIISYFGAGRHKARMVGIAVIISSLGSILMAMPHFITGPYRLGEDSATSLCLLSNSTTTTLPSVKSIERCEAERENGLYNYLYVFILGQMLHGVGGTTIYTVGVALIDDSVKPASTPLYLGILYGSAVLGPGLGYVVGGQFLSYYVDFDIVDTKMTSDDPRWVGAWWLGFILAAAVNLLVSFPILCFGAELPTASQVQQIRVSEAHVQRVRKEPKGAANPASAHTHQSKSVKHFVQTSLSLLSILFSH